MGFMYYERAVFFAEQADKQKRDHYGWMASCAAVPHMDKAGQREFWNLVKSDGKRGVVRVGTEAGAVERAREMLKDGV